jgi:hypothetical protein
MLTRFFLYNPLFAIAILLLVASCEFTSDNNIDNVPEYGLFIYLEANRHESGDISQVAAAVFDDGKAVNLVGGDIFRAYTSSSQVLMKNRGLYTGSYSAFLPVSNLDQYITLTVVHEPLQAREDRWYPIDLIITDPGPGELVGLSATASFPPPLSINPLAITLFPDINTTLELRWDPLNQGDTMRIRSAVTCDNGLNISTYGTEFTIGDDDGDETIAVNNFIFDSSVSNPQIAYLIDIGASMLQQILDNLSAGKADPDFFAKKIPANPIESDCEIRLFLFRQRPGVFDTTFDSGIVIGSTSAEVVIYYSPTP